MDFDVADIPELFHSPASIIESDSNSISHDGPGQPVNTFDQKMASNIDKQLSFQDTVSLIFLTVEKAKVALQFCRNAEREERNIVYSNHSIMSILHYSLKNNQANKWPGMVYQALYQIGQRGILYYDFEMDLDEEEKQLEEAQKIIPERLLFFALVENLESAEQAALFHKLKEHHPSLENAKILETVFLQLLTELEFEEICSMVKESLETMERAAELKEVFLGHPACPLKSQSTVESYEKGPGLCIIINQKDFKMSTFEDRLGTDRDRDEIRVTFTLLGVQPQDMKVHNDLSDTEMRDKLEEMARRADSSQHHAWLAVIILSHGRRRRGEDEVMGVNGEGITRTQIVDMFTVNCPNFQNKPKFFWIQACRSDEAGPEEEAHDYERSRAVVTSDTAVPTHSNKKPALANCLVHFATVAKYNAFRNVVEGSFFIQNLCKVLKQNAETMNLESMLKIVNRKVTEQNPDFPSLPEYTSSLLKEFKFEITEESRQRFEELDRSL